MSPRKRPVPVNIIAGGLGAGKTTAVNHLLGQRPKGERWAILVNEYGEVGVDAALLGQQDSGSGVEIRELAGGCICCTAGFLFEMSLVTLLGRRPDRLIIEPTGLATLTGIIEVLELPGLRDAVDLRSVITLVDGTRVNAGDATPEEQDQIAAADILLVNHTDRAAPDEVAAFLAAANAAFPPRAHVGSISHARVPFRLLDLVAGGSFERKAQPEGWASFVLARPSVLSPPPVVINSCCLYYRAQADCPPGSQRACLGRGFGGCLRHPQLPPCAPGYARCSVALLPS